MWYCNRPKYFGKREYNHIFFRSDISMKSILLSKNLTKAFKNHIQYFVVDMHSLSLKIGNFALVFRQGLVEHCYDPVTVIKEQVQVVERGDILIISVPQRFTGYTVIKNWRTHKQKWHLGWEAAFFYDRHKKVGQSTRLKEKKVFGYQYWQSWKEPLFIFRDLYNRFHLRNSYRHVKIFFTLKRTCDGFLEFYGRKMVPLFSSEYCRYF